MVFWPGLGDPFVCQSPIGVYASHFLGQVPGCAYTVCLYGRIKISCTFPSGPPCRPSRVSPYTPSVLICCIRLLCDWSFRLYYYYSSSSSSLGVFQISFSWWFFYLSLSDSKSPRVSRTLLSILAILNNAVVWMVSTRPPVPLIILWWLYQKHQSRLVYFSPSCSIVFSIP